MVTMGIPPPRENSHGRTGNRTRNLFISSQRLWPLDHEACQLLQCKFLWNCITILRGFYCYRRQIAVKMWTWFSRFTTWHDDEILSPLLNLGATCGNILRETTFCIEVSLMILTLNIPIISQRAMYRVRSPSFRTSQQTRYEMNFHLPFRWASVFKSLKLGVVTREWFTYFLNFCSKFEFEYKGRGDSGLVFRLAFFKNISWY
jgi:hypothetical protein